MGGTRPPKILILPQPTPVLFAIYLTAVLLTAIYLTAGLLTAVSLTAGPLAAVYLTAMLCPTLSAPFSTAHLRLAAEPNLSGHSPV